MKKKLLLTLLPLAFFVAACSGANRPAESSHSTGLSSSSSNPTSSGESSGAEPSSEPSGDGEGHSSLIGEGFEIKVGDLYYTLEERAEPDQGRTASYSYEDLDFTAGDKVSVYLDGGEALAIWAEADTTNGVYPNYDERPGPEQHTEFTVTETATGDAYFHINSDDSYSLWLTPNQSGGEGGGGEGGQTTGSKYVIYSVTNSQKICDLVLDGSKDLQGRDQATALSVSLTAGDVIQLYDTENNSGWITTVEGYSFGGASADATDWQAYLTAGTDSWTVVQSCTVDIYAKFAFGNDSIYFGLSA